MLFDLNPYFSPYADNPGLEYLSVNKVYAVTFVLVLQKIPLGNKIPSEGKFKVTTSPDGTSITNKVVPVFEVVVSSKTPAATPSDATDIALNLTGGETIAAAPAAAADLVACISCDPIFYPVKIYVGPKPHTN
jgi:hypothetical protein